MTRGYLLDTCIISYWFNENREPQHSVVSRRIDALDADSPLFISAVTLGEIEYGYRTESQDQEPEVPVPESQAVLERLPVILDIRRSTTTYYGHLRAGLFEKCVPRDQRKRAKRPEQLVDPITARDLGIDENDLWLAAQAFERRLILATHDRMARIAQVISELKINLTIEDWVALS
jgi:predicted nucleic acid-binding protein